MKLSDLAQKLIAALDTTGGDAGGGDPDITAVNSLEDAQPGQLAFLAHPRYAHLVPNTAASAVLLPADYDGPCPAAKLLVPNVDAALEAALALFTPDHPVEPGVHPTAVVAPDVSLSPDVAVGPHAVLESGVAIGPRCVIGPGCVLRRDVQLGEDCFLDANVVIGWGCRIGCRVRIYANVTIGADGFGYRFVDGRHQKIPHVGIVLIEDDVEIGANSCIDRAKFDATRVGQGTKIDNLVQIAHNVQIGKHCILVSQVGIAGSARLEDFVVLGGQVGIADHLTIGKGAQVGAKGGVMADVPPGQRMIGSPARPARRAMRELACIQKLPDLLAELQPSQKRKSQRAQRDETS